MRISVLKKKNFNRRICGSEKKDIFFSLCSAPKLDKNANFQLKLKAYLYSSRSLTLFLLKRTSLECTLDLSDKVITSRH